MDDNSEMKSIDELHRYGWNCKPAQKGKDSILNGIDLMKRYKIFITTKSTNTIQEFRNYKWIEDKNGTLLNKPVDKHNHSIDSCRYSIFSKLSRPNGEVPYKINLSVIDIFTIFVVLIQ